jgi:cyclopropane-fatty-acyl-phospholipid synthase
MLVGLLLRRIIRHGTLKVIDANGKTHVFAGDVDGSAVTIRLHDPSLHHRLFFDPHLVAGEAITDGTLTVEDGTIYDFVDLVSSNIGWGVPDHWLQSLINCVRVLGRSFAQYNPRKKSKKNVAHHYDLSGELYELFLDKDRQYSCAYFRKPDDDLETAQLQKKRHLAGKLRLQPGQKLLDIGSGWGGLGLYLAKQFEADVTGVTLSEEQLRVSNERADAAHMSDQVRFMLQDYRNVEGRFDRIVSVGMFEHVGVRFYKQYFGKIHELLDEDGVAVLHTIGRADGPGTTNAWIRKYIFPGGYSPALSEISKAIEKAGLYTTDIEIFRLQYAQTLRAWRERFLGNRKRALELYDERFCRMWELYLAASECAFRYTGHVVFQIQMTKRPDAVPETRDYITTFDGLSDTRTQLKTASGDSRAA